MSVLDEPTVIQTQNRGLAGTGMTEPRALQIEADLATMLARPVVVYLADLLGVLLIAPSDGQSLVYNDSITGFTNGTPTASVTIADDADTTGALASKFLFTDGLEWNGLGGDDGEVKPTYAGTGSAETVARSDHSHNARFAPITDIAATGTISSGTRTLATINVGPLISGVVYDLDATGFIVIRNDVSNGAVELRLQVNGGTVKTMAAANVGGVPSGFSIEQEFSNATGAGATVPVVFSLAYTSGDASDIRVGQLSVKAHPRR